MRASPAPGGRRLDSPPRAVPQTDINFQLFHIHLLRKLNVIKVTTQVIRSFRKRMCPPAQRRDMRRRSTRAGIEPALVDTRLSKGITLGNSVYAETERVH